MAFIQACEAAVKPFISSVLRRPHREGERGEHHWEDLLTGHRSDPEQVRNELPASTAIKFYCSFFAFDFQLHKQVFSGIFPAFGHFHKC